MRYRFLTPKCIGVRNDILHVSFRGRFSGRGIGYAWKRIGSLYEASHRSRTLVESKRGMQYAVSYIQLNFLQCVNERYRIQDDAEGVIFSFMRDFDRPPGLQCGGPENIRRDIRFDLGG